MHPSCLPLEKLEQQCRWSFSRASGPGGQHRNKVETAATIEHLASGIRASASEERSQQRNRQVAMHRLRCALAVEYRETTPQAGLSAGGVASSSGGSELWRTYCLSGRIRISETNEHFPSLLAELIGAVLADGLDLSKTAERLGTTSTQLVKFFSIYPPALVRINQGLVEQGFSPRVATSKR
jgi:protein subunit release factor A